MSLRSERVTCPLPNLGVPSVPNAKEMSDKRTSQPRKRTPRDTRCGADFVPSVLSTVVMVVLSTGLFVAHTVQFAWSIHGTAKPRHLPLFGHNSSSQRIRQIAARTQFDFHDSRVSSLRQTVANVQIIRTTTLARHVVFPGQGTALGPGYGKTIGT